MTCVVKHAVRWAAMASALIGSVSGVFAQADLSPQQLESAHRATVGQRTPSPHRPAPFNLQIGDTVPGSAPTYDMPGDVKDKAIRRYQYMVIDNRMVLVDPTTRRIIDIVR